MVEATMGVVLLMLAAVAAIQLVLVFHAALAAHSAAARSARAFALTWDYSAARRVYQLQQSTALRAISWGELECDRRPDGALCVVRVDVPSLLPGGGLFMGDGGNMMLVSLTENGFYPNFERAN